MNIKYENVRDKLKIDCNACSGLCCVALYCSKTDGFPANKEAGTPCRHLESNYRCNIHSKLLEKNYKGCITYDCFGAGQKTTQLFEGVSWKENSKQKDNIFDIFLILFQLHQMLWYLIEASTLTSDKELLIRIEILITEYERMLLQSMKDLVKLDLKGYRNRVNAVLKQICNTISSHESSKKNKVNYFGKNFHKANLDHKDFSMSLMIAANFDGCSLKQTSFLGADIRDANLCNADLRESVFLTQMQINSAKGNLNTRIPFHLSRPISWQE